MSKTPISILQEMMVKRQQTPNYELIRNGGGTHINTFAYKVTCDGLTAVGEGRSKKDAKHEAANAMLKAIAEYRNYPQLPASPAESPVRTPLPKKVPETPRVQPTEPFVNAVGILQTLCTENNLNTPQYEVISDVGPSHAKIFTTECRVASFVETGTAKTKKQAKQEAAKKMLHKLTDLIPDLDDTEDAIIIKETTKNNHEIAKARYPALSRLPKKICMGITVKEYHTKFRDSFESDVRNELIEKLEALLEEEELDPLIRRANDVTTLIDKLKDILLPNNLDISFMDLPSKQNVYVVCTRVNSSPDIAQVSMGKTKLEATYQTLIKTIQSMILFLK